jgi:anti-sigma B factor antagonist
MPFTVTSQTSGDTASLQLHGELDFAGVDRFRQASAQLLVAGPATLVLDVSDLQFLDSCGVGAVVGTYKRAAAHGTHVVMLSPTRPVHRVLKLTQVDRLIPVFADRLALEAHLAPVSEAI